MMDDRDIAIRVKQFGPFEVWVGGERVPTKAWRQRKTQMLLKIFLSDRGRIFSQDQLLDDLFPEGEASPKNLQNRISELRKFLEPGRKRGQASGFIERAAQGGYRIRQDAVCWIDTEVFEEHLNAGRAFEDSERWSQAFEHYEAAVALYRGEYLAEDVYEDWSIQIRNHFRERFLEVLERLAVCHRRFGQYAHAIECCDRLIREAPARERAYAQKMLSHYYAGEQQQALYAYQGCVGALKDTWGQEPSPATRKLYLQIREGTLAEPARAVPNNLSQPITRFIGREAELDDVGRLLEDDGCRLLTLVGPGGIGKTRLALEAAAHQLEAFVDGVFFVPLASVNAVDQLVFAVGEALRFKFAGQGTPQAQLFGYVRGKEMLLVLDNFEHLLQAVTLVSQLLAQAPRLKLLATSRESLKLHGETLFDLKGLGVPPATGAGKLAQYSAVQLFAQSARRADPTFRLSPAVSPDVVRVCELVGGMPLGIELAAAWLPTLPLPEIAAEIETNLDFLTADLQGLPQRHRSLRAVFASTWARLNQTERDVFMKLSVFRGGFTREAAQQVAGASLAGLMALRGKSLLQRQTSGRYETHELLRQFGENKLEASTQFARIHRCHLDVNLELAQTTEPKLNGADQQEWLATLQAEQGNITAALRWALAESHVEQALQLAGSLWRYWALRGTPQEGLDWLTLGLKRADGVSTATRAKAFSAAGSVAWQLGHLEQAKAYHHESLDLYRQLDDQRGIAFALNNLGVIALDQGDFDLAETRLEESLMRYRQLDDDQGMGTVLNNRGSQALDRGDYAAALGELEAGLVHARRAGDVGVEVFLLLNLADVGRQQGRFEQAIGYYQHGLDLAQDLGHKWAIPAAMYGLGMVALNDEQPEQARGWLSESLKLGRENGDKWLQLQCLEGLGKCGYAQGMRETSAQLLGAVEALRAAIGFSRVPAEQADHDHTVTGLRNGLEATAFDGAWARGGALTLEEAVNLALATTA